VSYIVNDFTLLKTEIWAYSQEIYSADIIYS